MVFPIVGGNQATGDFITNSLRFEDGGSPYLTHTRGTATNEKKFTFSTWVKLGNTGHGVNGTLFGSGDDGNGYVGDALIIQTNGLVKQGDHDGSTDNHNVRTNALLIDPSAWYHIVCAADSTQGTASNRIKLYINGTQQTSLAATTYPSQDITFDCNTNGQVLNIGRNQNGENHVYFDGYMAETVFIDGQQLAASSFGETDDNGVWIPKDISKEGLTFGNNGFYLQYQQTGTSADASGKGADTSGEDTHFDDNGMTAEDITTDTPQNNFATFNPLDNDTITGAASFSEGNLVINANGDPQSGCPSTIAVSNGAWYIEGKCLSGTFEIGVFGYGDGFSFNLANHPPYGDNGYPFLYEYGGNIRINNVNSQTSVATFTTNDILAIALDMDNNTIKFFKNGSQVGSTITDSNLSTFAPYSFYVANHTSGNTGNIFSLNTGNPVYTISSGNADANGYGNFEYAPPSGYYALCTKNLAEYG
jgi:hypothetical protein